MSPLQQQTPEQTAKIRDLNDALRTVRDPIGALMFNGSLVITRALADKGNACIDQAVEAMRMFSNFTPDNDPWSEHDFAAFEVDGVTCNFKIDYFASDLEHGSEAPWDAGVTRRVLTLMLAQDY